MSNEKKHEDPDLNNQENPENSQTEETPDGHTKADEERKQDSSKAQDETKTEQSEKTQEQLLQEKVDNVNDKLLRTIAEYDNFRKRSQREKDAIYPQATAKAVEKFLPIIDTIERALSVECSDEEFKKGVEMILQNFKDALENLGVEEFGEAGEQFDPEKHNAVMHVEDEEHEANSIAAVFQKGYCLNDKIIRHAMVQVAN